MGSPVFDTNMPAGKVEGAEANKFALTLRSDNAQQNAALHSQAAEQLERAARHHREAARCYERGDTDTARFHAYLAQGYVFDIAHFANKISEYLSTELSRVSVTDASHAKRSTHQDE
jgi:hypothetical protein